MQGDVSLVPFLTGSGGTISSSAAYSMFAYCGNNPVNRKDTSGQGWLAALKVVVVIVIIVVVVIVVAEIAKDAIINKQEGINPVEKELAKKDPIGAYKGNKAKEIAKPISAGTISKHMREGCKSSQCI